MTPTIPEKYKNVVVIAVIAVLVVILAYVLYTYMYKPTPVVRQPQITPSVVQQPQKVETYTPTGKPTLVLFYGDWCDWSKKILPTWEKVKSVLTKTDDVEVLDFEDNRDKEEIQKASNLPGFRGFPDIRFYPQGYNNGEPVAYTGDRSEESILQFVYENQH
jgi:thiol-disulfide isomerase/thioredoxin